MYGVDAKNYRYKEEGVPTRTTDDDDAIKADSLGYVVQRNAITHDAWCVWHNRISNMQTEALWLIEYSWGTKNFITQTRLSSKVMVVGDNLLKPPWLGKTVKYDFPTFSEALRLEVVNVLASCCFWLLYRGFLQWLSKSTYLLGDPPQGTYQVYLLAITLLCPNYGIDMYSKYVMLGFPCPSCLCLSEPVQARCVGEVVLLEIPFDNMKAAS